jgi:hypothetical protein
VRLVGVLVLALGVTVLVALADDPGPALKVSVAGPAPAPMNQPPTREVPSEAPATPAPDSLSVTRVHPRTAPDDPVVRPPAADPSASTSSPILPPPQSTTLAPGPALGPCPASEVKVTVATDRSTYGRGQTVQGSSTLENRSVSACLLPTRAFFRIVNGAGSDVSSFAYTADFRSPVGTEPGKTFTSTFTWDQKDCSGRACVQVAPGTYTVTADWTESGPYAGSATFQVTS